MPAQLKQGERRRAPAGTRRSKKTPRPSHPGSDCIRISSEKEEEIKGHGDANSDWNDSWVDSKRVTFAFTVCSNASESISRVSTETSS